MKLLVLAPLVFAVACGGGGGNGDSLTSSQNGGATANLPEPTAAELFADCLQQDATELARVLGLLQGFFSADTGGIPMPTFDLVSGLLSGGRVPFAWDLDGDQVNELSGVLRFLDERGATTIPFSLGELVGLDLNDPASLLAAVPAGSRLEILFEMDGTLVAASNGGAGDGTLVFSFGEDGISGIAGGGSFSAGTCQFGFDFDNVALDADLLAGFPVAEIDFTAEIGDDALSGTISLDGTGTAAVSTSLNGGTAEEFSFELPDIAGLPDLGNLVGQ